jgi:chromosome partitioning protein
MPANWDMSRVFVFSSNKGGVGKTTSTINFGAALAQAGKKVVLVDLDPQANLTKGVGLENPERNIYGALLKEYPLKVYPTTQENLFLVAGSAALSSFEKVKGDELDREYLLKELLAPVVERCDFVLLDCPPALNLLTINAYTCAHYLCVPTEAQLYALEGLKKALDLVQRVQRRLNPALQVAGIFLTRYNSHKVLHREMAEALRTEYPDLLLKSVIRESISLGEAPHTGKSIFAYQPASAGAHDYQALATEVLSLLYAA